MKRNYYKAMAAAIAFGMAVTPSVSFAAGMEAESLGEVADADVNAGSLDIGWEEDADWEEVEGEEEEADWEEVEGEEDGVDWEEESEEMEGEEDGVDWEEESEEMEGEEEEDAEEGEDADWEEEEEEEDADWEEEDEAGWEEIGEEEEGMEVSDTNEAMEDVDEGWDYDYSDGINDAAADPAVPKEMEDGISVCQAEAVAEDTPNGAETVPVSEKTASAGQEAAPGHRTASSKGRTASKSPSFASIEYADSRDNALAGVYQANGGIKIHSGAGQEKPVLAAGAQDGKFYCYGYYTEENGEKWLYVQYFQDGAACTGFVKSSQLRKETLF